MPAFAHVCRICGRPFEFPKHLTVRPCPGCGTPHARPENAAKGMGQQWLSRANKERAACEYKRAEEDYRQALGENPEDHEALWGLVLCKYGVEFVRDPYTQALLPTLHFLSRTPITEDDDYLQACMHAPEELREQYQREAAYIEQVQRQLIAPDGQPPVDIFLCYKAKKEDGQTDTPELHHARDLYHALQDMGYSVFFAHDTLQKIAAGANYEAKIFHALFSAKVMLVVCSEPAHLESPWVRSEWRRFILERCDKNEPCRIIPLFFDNFEPYDLPVEFRRRGIQGIQMGEISALDNLRSNLQSIIQKQPAHRAAVYTAEEKQVEALETLLLPIEYELSRGSWKNVADRCGKLIMKYPTCARLYLYRLLATRKQGSLAALCGTTLDFKHDPDWEWALKNATSKESAEWRRLYSAHEKLMREKREREAKEEAARQAQIEQEEAQRRKKEEEQQRRLAMWKREDEERYELCCQLLRERKWDDAAAMALRMHDAGLRELISVQANYRIATEAELLKAEEGFFNDNHWKLAIKYSTVDNKKKLQHIEATAREHHRSDKEKAGRRELLLTPLISTALLVAGTYGVVGLQQLMPRHFEGLFYVSAAVVYVVFAYFYIKYAGRRWNVIGAGVLMTAAGIAFMVMDRVYSYLIPLVVVFIASILLYVIRTCYRKEIRMMIPPVIWMMLYAGSWFLNNQMQFNLRSSLFGYIFNFCRSWGAALAIALCVAGIVKSLVEDLERMSTSE